MRVLAVLLVLVLPACGLWQRRTVELEEGQSRAQAERYCEERGMEAYAVEDPEGGPDTYQCL